MIDPIEAPVSQSLNALALSDDEPRPQQHTPLSQFISDTVKEGKAGPSHSHEMKEELRA